MPTQIQQRKQQLPQPGDKVWTPSDWAWAGGLLNALLPALMLGVPVVSSPAQKFDPHMAFRIMAEMKVRNAFIPPTALRLLKSVEKPREAYDLVLRSIGSAGESLGRETYEWVKSTLGIVPNEFYGQTECNFVLSSAAHLGVSKGGFIGILTAGEMGLAFGRERAIHAALAAGGLTKRVVEEAARLSGLRVQIVKQDGGESALKDT